MEIFIKAAAGVLITVVLSMILSKQAKDFSSLLTICVCTMVAGSAMLYFKKILDFISLLQDKGNINQELLSILLKSVGIGILAEITSMVCADSGNQALGKTIQILSTTVILWLCIPMFEELITIVEGVLSNL